MCETAGEASALGANLIHLIPKAAGGLRPIAVMNGITRLWAAIRRPYAQVWEKANHREFFAKDCPAALFSQCIADEALSDTDVISASVFIDIEKCFEHMDHQKLIGAAAL